MIQNQVSFLAPLMMVLVVVVSVASVASVAVVVTAASTHSTSVCQALFEALYIPNSFNPHNASMK